MGRLAFQFFIFLFGVSLAVAIAYASRPPSEQAVARTPEPAATARPEPQPVVWTQVVRDEQRTAASAEEKQPDAKAETNAQLVQLQSLGAEARRNLLVQAVHEGSISSLRFANSKILVLLPDYREQLLPTLKKESLRALLSRFREVDWSKWHLSSFARDGGPTAARGYVDLVSSVNPELGRYLETAAQLFRGLAVSTRAGKPLLLEDALSEALRSSERPVQSTSLGGSGHQTAGLLDAEILGDTVFRGVFEEVRGRLIASFIDSHREQPLTNLQLLLSADPKAADSPLTADLLHLLRQFALEASPRYREQVFEAIDGSATLEAWAAPRPQVKRAIAQLYLIGAMDALEIQNPRRAALFLEESVRLTPGLRGQELIGHALRASVETEPAPAKKALPAEAAAAPEEPAAEAPPEEPKPARPSSLFPAKDRADDSAKLTNTLKQGISYLSVILLILLVAGGGLLVFLYRRSLASVRLTGGDMGSAESGSQVRITAQSEMNFDEEFELGSRARQSPF